MIDNIILIIAQTSIKKKKNWIEQKLLLELEFICIMLEINYF